MATTIHRLPGVRFETPQRPLRMTLPRMDIAGFVGLSRAGPFDVPVPIEDVARFRELFGEDVELAWDAARGTQVKSLLGPCVEHFFRNGGRRCWVVRVGDGGVRRELEIPGLFQAPGKSSAIADMARAIARARSAGTWADDLLVGALLREERLAASAGSMLTIDSSGSSPEFSISIEDRTLDVEPDELIRLEYADGVSLYLFVDALSVSGSVGILFAKTAYRVGPADGASPSGPIAKVLDAPAAALFGASQAALLGVYRVRFDLLAGNADEGITHAVRELGFGPKHPRYWVELPDDEQLFDRREGLRREPDLDLEALWAEVTAPRFPLAGGGSQDGIRYLPLGMSTVAELSSSAPERAVDALIADGITALGAALFIDADLSRCGALALSAEAEAILYAEPARRRALRGLHALWTIDEVTLLALPDAVHAGAAARTPSAELRLAAPWLGAIEVLTQPDRVLARWTPVPGAGAYRLAWSESPDFELEEALELPAEAEPFALVPLAPQCPRQYFFRVRALSERERGPWSNSAPRRLPADVFDACADAASMRLELELAFSASPAERAVQVAWTPLEGVEFQLVVAQDPDFAVPREERRTSEAQAAIVGGVDGELYLRVRAIDGERVGPWSITLHWIPARTEARTLGSLVDDGAGVALAVHRAALRFCAARGDVLALLSTPRGFLDDDVIAHVARLRPASMSREASIADADAVASTSSHEVPALTPGESDVLAYGALYHPWILGVAEAEGVIVHAPPEGAVAGIAARLALSEGAWHAPANQPLVEVLALDTPGARQSWFMLSRVGVNLVQADPRGFLVLDASTLAREPDRRPINVRRLMMLLRRLALREGTTYVFEPHDEELRSLVRHRFEQMLSDLYVRGAFAGATPTEGFQVVADGTVNTPASTDRGQFLIELRVAPSRPLVFLTVRLLQEGPERLVLEEV